MSFFCLSYFDLSFVVLCFFSLLFLSVFFFLCLALPCKKDCDFLFSLCSAKASETKEKLRRPAFLSPSNNVGALVFFFASFSFVF